MIAKIASIMAELPPSIKEGSGEGSWITTGFIVAFFAGIAGIVIAYRKGAASKEVVVKPEQKYVTQEELAKLEEALQAGFERIQEQFDQERGVARTANGNIHKRIDVTQSIVTEMKGEMKGELKHLNQNVQRLLDYFTNANHKK